MTATDQGPRQRRRALELHDHLEAAAVSELVVIEGDGHANLMDNAERSNAAVVDFLRRVDGRGPRF